MRFVLRLAQPEDAPVLYEILRSAEENGLTADQIERGILTQDALALLLHLEGCRGWLTEVAGQITGFCLADQESAAILGLFVRADHQGTGQGRALLEQAVCWLRTVGAKQLTVHTAPNSRAAGFYQHLGWQIVGQTCAGELKLQK